MFRYFSLIGTNAFRNRRRSLLTVGSIAVSLCMLSVLLAAYRVLFLNAEASPAETRRLMTHHRVSITQPMPVSYEALIRKIPGVQDVMVWQWFGGTYKDARDPRNFFARFAVEPDHFFQIRGEIALQEAEKLAFEHSRTGCIVGERLAARFNWKPGDRVTIVGDIFPVTLELSIVGVYNDPNDNETLYFNYEYLHELDSGANEVGVFQVEAARAEDVNGVASAIDQEFENSPAPTETETERAWQLSFISFLGDLKLFFISICGALTFTILMVSANTISMATRERMRETGILKTLGFTPGAILGMTICECTLISLAGGAFGLLFADGVCILVRHSGTAFSGLNLAITGREIAAVPVVAVALGVTSSVIPAWIASRIQILDALRHSG